MLERDILRGCLDWLHVHGIYAWRQNQGAIPTADGRFRRFVGLKGVSDILGILPQTVEVNGEQVTFGNLLAIETKMPGKKLSADQQAFLEAINARGGLGLCVHSIEELETGIRDYL